MKEAESAAAVQKMQDYIEANIKEKISLKALGEAAGYSPWHAARLFKDKTGRAPFDYIRQLRLSRAALTLREGGKKVLDVALDFVFDSHEGFTRAFSKEFGMLPKEYRLKTPPIKLFMPEKVFDAYMFLQKGECPMKEKAVTKTIFVQVVERPARKVLMKRGVKAADYFEYCEELGCDTVWQTLCSVKEALYEPVGMWLPRHLIREGTSEYVQGVEVPLCYSNLVPEGFELLELPPATMMVFQGEPYDDADFTDAIGEVWEHIEQFDPALYGYEWAPEAAPRFQLAPMGYRGYIEALPVTRRA